MAILSVSSFEGTADVLGSVRRVGYSEERGEVVIAVPNAEVAVEVLQRLSLGEVQALTSDSMGDGESRLVRTAFKQESDDQAVPTAAPEPEQPPSSPPTAGQVAPGRHRAPKQQGAPTPPPKQMPQPKAQQAPGPQQAPEPKPAPKSQPKLGPERGHKSAAPGVPAKKRGTAPKPAPPSKSVPTPDLATDAVADPGPVEAPEVPAPPAVSTDSLPKEVVEARKIRDVVNYFDEQGMKTSAQIIAACVAIKGQVKVLSRVRNLEDRVGRACKIMGLD